VSPITGVKNMSLVKAFFEFALSNEWINRNPARLVRNPKGRVGDAPRMKERSPFTDDELKRCLRHAKPNMEGGPFAGRARSIIDRLGQPTP
jgi:site-specific recombinase XerD